MKKIILFSLIFSLLFLTSCMPQNTEIKYRLVIEGIGIDYDNENNLYELTVQVLETSEGNPEQGKSDAPVINYYVKGKTVAEAINSLGENTGKYPLYSQNRLILIGSSVTGDRLIKALNFFVREYTSRPDVFVAAASGKASDILTVDTSGEVPAKLIEDEIRQCNENSVAVGTELYNAVNLSLEETTCFTLPLAEVTKDRIPEEKTVKITGARVCSDDIRDLSANETMSYLFISDKVKSGAFSLKTDEYDAALEIIRSKTKTKLTLQEGKPVFQYIVSCEVDVVEFAGDSFSSFTESDIDEIEKIAADYIKSGMDNLFDRFVKEEKCDIFRLGTRLARKYPDIYKTLKADWENSVSSISCVTDVSVKVGRIGQMTVRE